MHLRHGVFLFLVLVGTTTGVTHADDQGPSSDRRTLLTQGLDLVRVRVQAQVGLADTLREAGRVEEAITAYRQASTIYETELKRIEKLIGFVLHVRPAPMNRPPRDAVPDLPPRPEGAIQVRKPLGLPFGRTPSATQAPKAALDAADLGLRWLAAHQASDGGWRAEGFGAWCDGKPATGEQPDGPGRAAHDVGVTGLALCAFLGAGYTNRGKHPFARVVGMGLRYLKNQQDAEGCFGPRTDQLFIYNHATAALAMVEAYGMTGSPIFKGAAQRALDFIALCRNPYLAWRYGVKPGDNDTSVSGWMLMPLKSAQIINNNAVSRGRPKPLVIDESAFDGMRAWLDKVTDPKTGRVGYLTRGTGSARPQELLERFPAAKSEAMTAVGAFSRIMIGDDPRTSPLLQKSLNLLRDKPPVWNVSDGSVDMLYWYAGLLATFQAGGELWNGWRKALSSQVLPMQRRDTTPCLYKGSWDPVGVWGLYGGRVYATAMMTLCAEVFYRYGRVVGTK